MSQPLQYLFLVRVVEDRFGLATSVLAFNDQSSLGTEFFLVLSLIQNGALYLSLVMDFVLHLPHCPATWLCHTDLWRVSHSSSGTGENGRDPLPPHR